MTRSVDSPSNTLAGQLWADQFRPDDMLVARALLDSIKLVDEGAFFDRLGAVLDWQVKALTAGPVVLIPVGEEPVHPDSHLTYDNVDSRQITMAVCRQVALRNENVIRSWDIADIRSQRVRHAVFVDDLVASGKSLKRATLAWTAHRSFRSWMSYGLIDVQAVSYAATTKGLGVAKALGVQLTTFDASCDIPAASRRTPEISASRARGLCKEYGRKPVLGFGGAEALIVLQHTVPNSLPSIFWQDRDRNNNEWLRLVNRSTYEHSGDFGSAMPYAPSTRTREMLAAHATEVSPAWIANQPTVAVETLLVAVLTTRSGMTPHAVSQTTGLPPERVGYLLGNVSAMGMLDSTNLRRELRNAGSGRPWRGPDPMVRQGEYFPQFSRESG